jgi:hypothetical protein
MFVPIILGSDKTTVSVGTGNNKYWPLYGSIGNIHNNIRRAHGSGLVLIGFLAIPHGTSLLVPVFTDINTKAYSNVADNVHSKDPGFRRFRRQLFHSSLSTILETLRPGMNQPEIVRCADGHFRKVIWGLGPYIADYPEQVLLACVVTNWCPR